MKTTLEILQGARALIAAGFIQKVYAADIMGNPVDIQDRDACKFCSYGAIARVAGMNESEVFEELPATKLLKQVIAIDTIANWNDHHDKAEVLAAFDQAIQQEIANASSIQS